MKNRVNLFVILAAFLLLLTGCANGQESKATEEEVGRQFLTEFFTTNNGGRWDTYQTADRSTEEAGSKAVEQYYSSFSAMCTGEGLASIAENRLPYTYDELAQEYHCTIKPEKIAFEEKEDHMEFTAELTVSRDGEVLGNLEQNGQLQFDQEGEDYLIDSVWIADMNDLTDFFAGIS